MRDYMNLPDNNIPPDIHRQIAGGEEAAAALSDCASSSSEYETSEDEGADSDIPPDWVLAGFHRQRREDHHGSQAADFHSISTGEVCPRTYQKTRTSGYDILYMYKLL